jgi:hypothetical protein
MRFRPYGDHVSGIEDLYRSELNGATSLYRRGLSVLCLRRLYTSLQRPGLSCHPGDLFKHPRL